MASPNTGIAVVLDPFWREYAPGMYPADGLLFLAFRIASPGARSLVLLDPHLPALLPAPTSGIGRWARGYTHRRPAALAWLCMDGHFEGFG